VPLDILEEIIDDSINTTLETKNNNKLIQKA